MGSQYVCWWNGTSLAYVPLVSYDYHIPCIVIQALKKKITKESFQHHRALAFMEEWQCGTRLGP